MNRNYTKKKLALIAFLPLLLVSKTFSQSILQNAANDAYAITRMVDRFHVQPKPVNDTFSEDVYRMVIKKLDPRKIFFTKQDITTLNPYIHLLDDEIKTKNPAFIQLLSNVYRQRVKQTDSIIDEVGKKPFNFSLKEKLTVTEDTSYAENSAALRIKIYKMMKLTTAHSIAEDYPKKASLAIQKKYTDSIEPITREHITASLKRNFKAVIEKENGLEKEVGNSYCESIANCFDPHSDYFPKEEKEEFETHLGKKPLVFGFTLQEEEDGTVKIASLEPGSPAYKSGQLNKGDKIQAVQWPGKDKVIVGDKGESFVNDLLDGEHTDKVTITVKKSDGSTRQVSLQKERVDNGAEDDDKVKSFILRGTKSIGYISLPAFYMDWDETNKGLNGCANDVAKEIVKLKEEHIDGLIVDVRYNGGGSIQEAIELAGIFIDAGPVAQIKEREGKPIPLLDRQRGTIYDGPMAIMVNGYSASASEMFAGTLQDYNRALVVGTPTFGKATGQNILPLDTSIVKEEDAKDVKSECYLKVTDIKLFRVTGKTAQGVGVVPDIVLPDVLSARAKREADDEQSLIVRPIEPNKYYQPFRPINLEKLRPVADSAINTWKEFVTIKKEIIEAVINKQKKDKSLLLADVLSLKPTDLDEDDDDVDIADEPQDTTTKHPESSNRLFAVVNHAYEAKRLQADSSQQETNDNWKGFIVNDPYIMVTYQLLEVMSSK